MKKQIEKIRAAYNLTVYQYKNSINPLREVPDKFRNSKELADLLRHCDGNTNSKAKAIKAYLEPKKKMKYLDAGCSANLVNYRLYEWPSIYYGIDISDALVNAMRGFSENNKLSIGELKIAEICSIPFPSDFFDIASLIGVLEYCTFEYARDSMFEFYRVLKPQSRFILDIPNKSHKLYPVMEKLEKLLKRPMKRFERNTFEEMLNIFFTIVDIDDSRVMIKYFLKSNKE